MANLDSMHVAVLIVGFKNSNDITRCLAALERSRHLNFEVMICENGGAAAFSSLVAVVPRTLKHGQVVRIQHAPFNGGYASGVNHCLGQTPHADAWWILNPDTEPHPEAMSAMLERLAKGDCDAVGGTLLLPNGKVQSHGGIWQSWIARPVSIGFGDEASFRRENSEIERTMNYLSGASMMIGRRFLEIAGVMREDYFVYCEEVEWCLRAQTLRARIGFAPRALVLHHQGTTTGNTTNAKTRSRLSIHLNERNKILLTRDLTPRRLVIAVPCTLALLLFRWLRNGATKQLLWGMKGWLAGLSDERGRPAWMED